MTIAPDRRLLLVLAAWTAAAFLAVFQPRLILPLFLILAGGSVLAALDLRFLHGTPLPHFARRLPERLYVGDEADVVITGQGAESDVRFDLYDEPEPDLGGGLPRYRDQRLAARAARTWSYRVHPTRRGTRSFGPLIATIRSPLGLFRRRLVDAADDSVAVYPRSARHIDHSALDPRRALALLGARPVPRRGEGLEFESLRDYQIGDDPRRIDWRATARRGRPVLRQFERDQHSTLLVAVDTGRLMGATRHGVSKLDSAVDAALALAYAALRSGDSVGLIAFDQTLHCYEPPRSHLAALARLLAALQPLQPALIETRYDLLARTVLLRQAQRALIVVLSDFVEAAPALVNPLLTLARRHQVLFVGLRDLLLRNATRPSPADTLGPFRRLVLHDLVQQRAASLAAMRRGGLHTLDLEPQRVTPALLSRYLELRFGRMG